MRLSFLELIPFALVPPTDNLVVLSSLDFLRFFFLLVLLSILLEQIFGFASFVDIGSPPTAAFLADLEHVC